MEKGFSNEAIILAGGLGTRLRNVISQIPKPMAPISGTPFLSFLLNYLESQKIKKVILSVGYKCDVIVNYYSHRYRDIEIVYSIENTPLGTGGAIKQALDYASNENVYILNGDTFFKVDFAELHKCHEDNNADLTLTLKPMRNYERYGTVLESHTRIVGFKEKKLTSYGLINGGVYLASKDLFKKVSTEGKFSFETDFIEKYFEQLSLHSYKSDGYFIDIGVPEDYEKAQEELINLV